jgi:hypothetical protein
MQITTKLYWTYAEAQEAGQDHIKKQDMMSER